MLEEPLMGNYCGGRKLGTHPPPQSLMGQGSFLRLFGFHVLDLLCSIFKAIALCYSLKGFYPDGNEVI